MENTKTKLEMRKNLLEKKIVFFPVIIWMTLGMLMLWSLSIQPLPKVPFILSLYRVLLCVGPALPLWSFLSAAWFLWNFKSKQILSFRLVVYLILRRVSISVFALSLSLGIVRLVGDTLYHFSHQFLADVFPQVLSVLLSILLLRLFWVASDYLFRNECGENSINRDSCESFSDDVDNNS